MNNVDQVTIQTTIKVFACEWKQVLKAGGAAAPAVVASAAKERNAAIGAFVLCLGVAGVVAGVLTYKKHIKPYFEKAKENRELNHGEMGGENFPACL